MSAKVNRLDIAPPLPPPSPEWETIWTCDYCKTKETTEGLYKLPVGWLSTYRADPRFDQNVCGAECLVLMALELKDGAA